MGLISGALGQGVGLVSEYRKHRQQQKQYRETLPEASEGQTSMDDVSPPAYDETTSYPSTPLVRGTPPTDEKEPALYEVDTDSSYESSLDDDSDDEAWALDEAGTQSDGDEPPSYDEVQTGSYRETTSELVQEIMVSSSTHPANPSGAAPLVCRPLPCPVILPQRRPKKRARGFVRAYAPVLADAGIDQETFLTFLKNLHKSSQASPIFDVIGVSARIAGFAPSVIALVVCAAVEVGARAGAEVQRRSRTNNFLDQVNETLFKPAGLFAMIVRYKPARTEDYQHVQAESVNLSTYRAIAKYSKQRSYDADGASSQSMGDRMSNLRLASDTTRGTVQMPEAAPLIYPELDRKLAQEGPESLKEKSDDAKKFVADYIDRRAQMSFSREDTPLSLQVPQPERTTSSGVANPDHAMYSGGLLALMTGGAIAPHLRKQERRANKHHRIDMRRIERGREPRHGYVAPSAEGEAGPSGGTYVHVGKRGRRRGPDGKKKARGVRRLLTEDALYLMIVNMPSNAELAVAIEELARAGK